jgi:sensor domain CHASE-containing protein
MKMRTTLVQKEWCEVRRKGRGKIEDWSWRVDYYDDGAWKDAHYINNEADAMLRSALFVDGAFTIAQYGEVRFDSAFA